MKNILRYIPIIFIIVISVAVLIFPRPGYDDRVTAIGDTVDYQTLAVNFAKRNVFPVSGFLLPDTTYRFQLTLGRPGAMTAGEFHSPPASHFTYYRNPIYPLFCGLIYKLWGVSPSVLYRIQFLLLVLLLCAMPAIGSMIAGRRGAMAGIISAIAIFLLMRHYAFEVQTQGLVLPYTIGLWWVLGRYLRRLDLRSSIIIGLYLGIGLLLKNFFIPVALLICCYRFAKIKQPHSLLLPLIIMITIIPYTVYINHQRGPSQPFIWITDQGDDVVLNSNNDLATDGDWHPDGSIATAFYQQPSIKAKSAWLQATLYMYEYPRQTALNMSEKIRLGLLSRWPPVLFVLMLMALYITSLFPPALRRILVPLFIISVMGCILFYLYGRDDFYSVQRTITAFLHGTGLLLLLFPVCYFLLRKAAPSYLSGQHITSWILLGSFLLLNMIFYGSDRIVGMVDFIWMFYAVLFALDLSGLMTE